MLTWPLQYQPFADGLVAHKYLDHARFCVASTMMSLYPRSFSIDETLDTYDVTRKTVAWKLFKHKLAVHFYSFTEIQGSRGWRKIGNSLHQQRSCFFGVKSLKDDFRFSEYPGEQFIVDRFAEHFVADYDEAGRIAESEDAFLKRQLDFFIPAIIWQYNAVKRALVTLDDEIYAERCNLYQTELALQYFNAAENAVQPQEPEPPVANSRFLFGTGADTRSSDVWKKFLSQVNANDVRIPRRGVRRKHEDVDGQDDRLSTPRGPSRVLGPSTSPHFS